MKYEIYKKIFFIYFNKLQSRGQPIPWQNVIL